MQSLPKLPHSKEMPFLVPWPHSRQIHRHFVKYKELSLMANPGYIAQIRVCLVMKKSNKSIKPNCFISGPLSIYTIPTPKNSSKIVQRMEQPQIVVKYSTATNYENWRYQRIKAEIYEWFLYPSMCCIDLMLAPKSCLGFFGSDSLSICQPGIKGQWALQYEFACLNWQQLRLL